MTSHPVPAEQCSRPTSIFGRDAALRRQYLFSAKGAAFIGSLGQRPRDSCNAKPPALKARFIPAPICVGLTANRCVAVRQAQALSRSRRESRFQRWSLIQSSTWGDAPGWYESALLALNRYLRRPPSRVDFKVCSVFLDGDGTLSRIVGSESDGFALRGFVSGVAVAASRLCFVG